MKKRIIITLLISLFIGLLAYGAGSISPSPTPPPYHGLNRLELDWTSDASGDVSGTTYNIHGYLVRVTFVPDSGTTQPSANYDVVLQDADDVDLLNGAGADLSSSTTTSICPTISDSFPAVLGSVELVVSNAGDSKGGTVILYYQEP